MSVLFAFSFFSLHWFSSLFMHSFFLHRYCAHRMFELTPTFEKLFYLLTYLTQGTSFLNPRSYSIMHQLHHQFSDSKEDPHSPHHQDNIFKMMIKTYQQYQSLLKTEVAQGIKEVKHHYPIVPWIDKMARTKFSELGWPLFYISIYLYFTGISWWLLFVPLHLFMGPMQGAIVNWFGHWWGYRNFNLADKSRNTLPVDFLLMGELYQNNHHFDGMRLNFARRWFEIDFTYVVMRILNFFRLIRMHDKV